MIGYVNMREFASCTVFSLSLASDPPEQLSRQDRWGIPCMSCRSAWHAERGKKNYVKQQMFSVSKCCFVCLFKYPRPKVRMCFNSFSMRGWPFIFLRREETLYRLQCCSAIQVMEARSLAGYVPRSLMLWPWVLLLVCSCLLVGLLMNVEMLSVTAECDKFCAD